jgi:hypothetical protein
MRQALSIERRTFHFMMLTTFLLPVQDHLFRYMRLSHEETKDLFPEIEKRFWQIALTNEKVLLHPRKCIDRIANEVGAQFLKKQRNAGDASTGL